MKVCGIEITGSQANLTVLDGVRQGFTHVDCNPRKLGIADDQDATHLKSFRDAMQAFVRDNHIALVAIKTRNKTGEFAGGAVGFKIEGIIQLLDNCEIRLVSPVTVASCRKKHAVVPPTTLKKYQRPAFEVAFTALPEN